MVTADRVTFTIRMPRAEYDALQRLYYQTVNVHRQSFNAWINRLIRERIEDFDRPRPIAR